MKSGCSTAGCHGDEVSWEMQVWKQATHHDRRQGNLPSVVLWHGETATNNDGAAQYNVVL